MVLASSEPSSTLRGGSLSACHWSAAEMLPPSAQGGVGVFSCALAAFINGSLGRVRRKQL